MIKRFVSILFCVVLMLCLAACGQGSGADKGVFIVNSYRYGDDADVPLPAGAVREDSDADGAPCYRIPRGVIGDYAKDAAAAGYTTEVLPYFTLLYRGGCYVLLSFAGEASAADAYLTVYCGVDTPDGGLSPGQARDIIRPGSKLLPIDVSPEGLFESTGGQIFMLPVYALDHYRDLYGTDADSDADIPENRYYSAQYYYVADGRAIPLDQPDLAFADLDGDGVRETVRLGFGPTSGIYTFTLTAYHGGEPIAESVFAPKGYESFSFTEADGKLRLASPPHAYEITVNGALIALTENGAPFEGFFDGER